MCQKVKASVLIEQCVIGSMQGYSRSMSWAPVWRSLFPFHFLHAFDNALSMRSKWLKMYAHAYCIWIFPWNRQAREWRDENWVLSCITCANFFHVQHILRVECVCVCYSLSLKIDQLFFNAVVLSTPHRRASRKRHDSMHWDRRWNGRVNWIP